MAQDEGKMKTSICRRSSCFQDLRYDRIMPGNELILFFAFINVLSYLEKYDRMKRCLDDLTIN